MRCIDENMARTRIPCVFMLILALLVGSNARAQVVGIKNNLLEDALLSPNLGVETTLSEHWSMGVNVSFNPFTYSDNKKLKHLWISPEARYWFSETYRKHFVGVNVAYCHFNCGNIKLPFGLYPSLKNERHQGDLVAAGAFYGYNHRFSYNWAIEGEIGLDLAYAWYDRYLPEKCGMELPDDKGLLLIPKVGINIVYYIGKEKKPEPMPEPVVEPLPKPEPEPIVNVVEDNTGKAGELEKKFDVLTHISNYQPYDAKIRRKGALNVHFPVGKTSLVHDYMNNAQTLDRICDITRQVMADTTSTVKLIQLVGLASPEGSVALNEKLADGRVKALRQYIVNNVSDTHGIDFEMVNGGEGWYELQYDLLHDSTTFVGKDELIRLIDEEPNPNIREQKMRRMNGGKTYNHLKQTVLSKQRNSGYIRIFYDYVKDTIAPVINQAVELIKANRSAEALPMLQSVAHDPRALNPLGVALYKTGDKAAGKAAFSRAAALGDEDAKKNLEMLK